MGHDICAIGNHKLNTTSMEGLAQDLSDRIDATVEFGYIEDVYIESEDEYIEKQIVKGKVEKGGRPKWFLEEVDYLDKIECPDFYSNLGCHYHFSCTADKNSFYIYQHCFFPNIEYDGRWWNFYKHFNGVLKDWFELDLFRKRIVKAVKKFGGDSAIYIGDEPLLFLDNDLKLHTTIHEFDSLFREKLGNDYLNISSFLKENNPIAHQPDKKFLVFYDDFLDLLPK